MYLWLVTGERFYESFLIDWLNSLLKLGQTLYKLLIPLKSWFVCRLGSFVFSLVVQGFFMVDFRSLPLLLSVDISLLLCSFCNLFNPCRRCKCGCPCNPPLPFQKESGKLTPPGESGCDGNVWVQSSSEPCNMLYEVCWLQACFFLNPAPKNKKFSFQNKTKGT